jgi:very-short-patch-repair endonuclease
VWRALKGRTVPCLGILNGGGVPKVAKKRNGDFQMSLTYNKKLIPLAKALRTKMTRQERHLWYDFLRNYPIRFQRQKTIDNYIADFYCHKAKLVIEIDGSQHYTEEGLEYDEIRTNILQEYRLEIIRFTNVDIDRNFVNVCQAIDNKVKQVLSTTP